MSLFLRSSVLLSLVAATPALAVQPPEQGFVGDGQPTRVHHFTASSQAYWERSPAWQTFLDQAGPWEAQFDRQLGTPYRAWGAPVALGADPVAALPAFVAQHADLFGTDRLQMVLTHDHLDPRRDARIVEFEPQLDGLPLVTGRLTFRLVHGQLVLFGAQTYPGVPARGEDLLGPAGAAQAAWDTHPFRHAQPVLEGQRAVWLPQGHGKSLHLRRAWEVRSTTASPVGQWVSYVDASTGELLSVHNEIRYFDGQITGQHDVRLGPGKFTTSPLPFVQVIPEQDTVHYADADGYSTFAGEDATISLDGQAVRLFDSLGQVVPALPADGPLTAEDFDGRQAALTTYVYLHQVRDWAALYAPDNQWLTSRNPANVNLNETCNAYFDGSSVNFFQAGDGCNNTGRLADVIFHEWGHGLHIYAAPWDAYDGSLGEGAADVVSFLMTDDHELAPYFFVGGGTLRDALNNRQYPDDFSSGDFFIHSNGMIFSGAMWDLRENLRDEVGEPTATELTSQLLVDALAGGPDIPAAYAEVVFADDDDGDLSNGTPHQCAILDAFAAHGLGPAAAGQLDGLHTPPERFAADAPNTLSAQILNPAPGCIDVSLRGGVLRWRIDGNHTWNEVNVTSTEGLEVVAELPALPMGTVVEYAFKLATDDGSVANVPVDADIRPFTAVIGDTLEVWCTNFEGSRAGFRSALLSDEEAEGANDWEWATPNGKAEDPAEAASGTNVWGNDLGGDAYDGRYQNNRHNQLVSPELGLAHYEDVYLQYSRWLTVEDGQYDRATIEADGTRVWGNLASGSNDGEQHFVDTAWTTHHVGLGEAVDDGVVTLSWSLESDGGLTFGGWNVDDVCLMAPATPGNRLGIVDFAVDRSAGSTTTFSWTQPKHGPVEEIRIVRDVGEVPDDVDDGVVVWSSTEVELGAPATATIDQVAARKGVNYAIYAYDGEEWLPWTRVGLNAARFDGDSTNEGLLKGELGCEGCASTGPRGWLGLGLLPLALLRRRRRSLRRS